MREEPGFDLKHSKKDTASKSIVGYYVKIDFVIDRKGRK